jgi:DNA-binding NtrC family response regulator
VRELENELARAWALADRTIDADGLSPAIASAPAVVAAGDDPSLELKPPGEALERPQVEPALGQTGGNQSAAAKLLGLSRFGLQKKLRRFGG